MALNQFREHFGTLSIARVTIRENLYTTLCHVNLFPNYNEFHTSCFDFRRRDDNRSKSLACLIKTGCLVQERYSGIYVCAVKNIFPDELRSRTGISLQ